MEQVNSVLLDTRQRLAALILFFGPRRLFGHLLVDMYLTDQQATCCNL